MLLLYKYIGVLIYYCFQGLYPKTAWQHCLLRSHHCSLKEDAILILNFSISMRFWNQHSLSVGPGQLHFSQNWSHYSHKILPFWLGSLQTLALKISNVIISTQSFSDMTGISCRCKLLEEMVFAYLKFSLSFSRFYSCTLSA